MVRKKRKDKTEDLIAELIRNELEAQLSRLVRKARRKATREAGKLNNMFRLEYHKDSGFVDAEVIAEPQPDEGVKKTEDIPDGEEQ